MSTVYCFLADELFAPKSLIDMGDKEVGPICDADENVIAYFTKRASITDNRTIRNEFEGKNDLKGSMQLLFDISKYQLTDIDPSLITEEYITNIFDVLEFVNLNGGRNIAEVEDELINNPRYSTVYLTGSFKRSFESELFELQLDVPTMVTIYDYFDIILNIPNPVTFRIWSNRKSFLDRYPLSTIMKVILPCERKYILDPSLLENNVFSIIASTEFSFTNIDTELLAGDQTGLLTYKTTYRTNAVSDTTLPFGIIYRGNEPSAVVIREAIRNELLGPGDVPESVWEALLPDLFVTSVFFMIPIWNNTEVRPDRVMYNSILTIDDINKYINILFPDLDPLYVLTNYTIMSIAFKEIFILAIGDPLNEAETNLRVLHPTYQAHSSQDSVFKYQEPDTQEFNIRLNRAMATLFGETTDSSVIIETVDEITWGSFISTKVEYKILTEASFTELFV